MGSEALDIKSSEALLVALRQAATVKPTGAQLLEQRASFVYGSMKPDNSISKEKIRQVLIEQDGGRDVGR